LQSGKTGNGTTIRIRRDHPIQETALTLPMLTVGAPPPNLTVAPCLQDPPRQEQAMDGKEGTSSLAKFIANYSPDIEPVAFAGLMVLAAAMAAALAWLYTRYGTCLSNRRVFARNFVGLAMTTMLIITIVRSSLALSLGLVGALSIVRFRAAIKEPEELMYLFMCIAIGLGCGAGVQQGFITAVGFGFLAVFVVARHKLQAREEGHNLQLTLACEGAERMSLERMLSTVKQHCPEVSLKRFDESQDVLEASLIVQFPDVQKLEHCRNALREIDRSVTISFLDSRAA
jgi:uncharacterized membrane protein YhiD involved in acid resistance